MERKDAQIQETLSRAAERAEAVTEGHNISVSISIAAAEVC